MAKIQKNQEGWVYFIKSGLYYKVGITTGNVKQRLSNYKTHNPNILKLLSIVYVNDCYEVEKLIQKSFFSKKTFTETDWEKLNKDTINKIMDDLYNYQQQYFAIPDYKTQLFNILY